MPYGVPITKINKLRKKEKKNEKKPGDVNNSINNITLIY
jgi:hypothetical protein